MSNIKVRINGNEQELEDSASIEDLLKIRNVTGKMFVVERNLEIVPKDQYHLKVENNDVFEIVGFFGGG